MKTVALFVGAVLLVASIGFAKNQSKLEPPNLIHCQNDHGAVKLDYAASSISGKPQFSLRIDDEQLFPPTPPPLPGAESLVQIATEASVFGTFVYAMDATHTPLDEPTYVYGFFLPSVSVDPIHRVTF